MAACTQVVGDRGGDRRLERQRAVKGEAAGRVRGLLDVEAAVEHAAQDLDVSRGLILTAHHAKRHDRFAVLRQQARNDGVERTFSRRDGIGMTLDEAESRTAVLQQHTRTRGIDAAAEGEEQRIDKGHHVAVAVGDCNIGGVTMDRHLEFRGRAGALCVNGSAHCRD